MTIQHYSMSPLHSGKERMTMETCNMQLLASSWVTDKTDKFWNPAGPSMAQGLCNESI